MPPASQLVDSLWRCLCPSFNITSTSLRRIGPLVSSTRHGQGQGHGHGHRAKKTIRTRQMHTAPATAYRHEPSARAGFQWQSSPTPTPSLTPTQTQTVMGTGRAAGNNDIRAVAAQKKLVAAAAHGDWKGAWQETARIAAASSSDEPPARLYSLLIEAACSTEGPSLSEVEQLVQEAEQQNITPDQDFYEALLKVLAIHPSYLLRQSVLEAAKGRWIELSHNSRVYVVCGLLRERQIELALDELATMHTQGIPTPTWLIDATIYVLADLGEFEALIPFLSRRLLESETPPSQTLVVNVLSRAAKEMHIGAVRLIWDLQVAPGLCNPSTGLCTAILDTAARAGDSVLATDVFRILGNRSSPLAAHQYEALIEAHMAAPEPSLYQTFSIISIMNQAQVPATPHVTRSIFLCLRSHPELLERAWETLGFLSKKRVTVPIELINVILEAALYQGRLSWAFSAYQKMHDLGNKTSGSVKATVATYNLLLRGCYKARRKDLAMFVAAEMVAMKIAPDALTYDRLILACLQGNGSITADEARVDDHKQDVQTSRDEEVMAASENKANSSIPLNEAGARHEETEADAEEMESESESESAEKNLDDAFRYLGEMQSRGWWPRPGTVKALGLSAISLDDSRIRNLVAWVQRLGGNATALREAMLERDKEKIS